MNRAEQIVAHVRQDLDHFWDAYNQGRWAFNVRIPRDQNPHIEGHICFSDWHRGWDEEAQREAV